MASQSHARRLRDLARIWPAPHCLAYADRPTVVRVGPDERCPNVLTTCTVCGRRLPRGICLVSESPEGEEWEFLPENPEVLT